MNKRNIEILDDKMAEVLKQKTPQERLAIAFGMWKFVSKQLKNYIRCIHPEFDEATVLREVAKRLSHGAV